MKNGREKMNELEKINSYVQSEIDKQLHNDALLFEIYKKDKRTVNFNRFLSMLLCGYFDLYVEENKKTYDALMNRMAQTSLKTYEQEALAENILKEIILPEIPTHKGAKPIRLSLKPTKETEPLIRNITTGTVAGNDSVSQYFCRMLMSYCKKPFSEREQIVFRDNYLFLQDACRKGQTLKFMTIWNDEEVRTVTPYCMAIGEEEMFNYLLCEEIHPKTGQPRPATYRLNRITKLTHGIEIKAISETVKKYCDRMKEYAPQYVITDDEEICVRLTDRGEMNFNRIYHGRPKPSKIEDKDDGHYYFFKCSKAQVFQYFKRFENDTVIIFGV
jgi:hypothetical protein